VIGLAELRTELRTEMAGLGTEMADTRATLSLDMAKQTRQLGLWMLGSQTSLAAIILAAIRL